MIVSIDLMMVLGFYLQGLYISGACLLWLVLGYSLKEKVRVTYAIKRFGFSLVFCFVSSWLSLIFIGIWIHTYLKRYIVSKALKGTQDFSNKYYFILAIIKGNFTLYSIRKSMYYNVYYEKFEHLFRNPKKEYCRNDYQATYINRLQNRFENRYIWTK